MKKRSGEYSDSRKHLKTAVKAVMIIMCLSAAFFVPSALNGSRAYAEEAESGYTFAGLFGKNRVRESDDKYIYNDEEYIWADDDATMYKPRLSYVGLAAFDRGEDILFTFHEGSPVYYTGSAGTGYTKGAFQANFIYGAVYYDGGILMPSSRPVICGSERFGGVSRYDLETHETVPFIASEESISSIVIKAHYLVYAADTEDSAEIKLCNLRTKKIFVLAKLDKSRKKDYPGDTRLYLCADRICADCGGKVYTISWLRDVDTVADGADMISVSGDRIFCFESVNRKPEGEDIVSLSADEVIIYDARNGKETGKYDVSGYTLLSGLYGICTYDGKMILEKDKAISMLDPVTGEAEKLCDKQGNYAEAACAGEKLVMIMTDDLRADKYDGKMGTVMLFSGSEMLLSDEIPNVPHVKITYEKLLYHDIGEAFSEIMYEDVRLPAGFENAVFEEICGQEQISVSYDTGEQRGVMQGLLEIKGLLDGKPFTMQIDQWDSVVKLDLKQERESPAYLVEELSEDRFLSRNVSRSGEPVNAWAYLYIIDDDNSTCIRVESDDFTEEDIRKLFSD